MANALAQNNKGTTGQMAMKSGMDIHGCQRMNPNYSNVPLSFDQVLESTISPLVCLRRYDAKYIIWLRWKVK